MSFKSKGTQLLQQVKDEEIINLKVVRTPLSDTMMALLTTASFGEFRHRLNSKPFDTLYHLMIYITTPKSIIGLERNEVVTIHAKPRFREELPFGYSLITKAMRGKILSNEDKPIISDVSEVIEIPIPSLLKVGAFIRKGAEGMGDKWSRYSARDNNCQDFVVAMLHHNGLLTSAHNAWIKQDTKDLFDDDHYLRRFTNTITDMGAIFAPFKPGFMASHWRDSDEGYNIVGQIPNTETVFRQGQKLYHNVNIPFMRTQGDIMSDADFMDARDHDDIIMKPALHEKGNISKLYDVEGDGIVEFRPIALEARRKKKNPFKKGGMFRKIARSVITGNVATDIANAGLKEAGVDYKIPSNRELLNLALKESGTGVYIPSEGEMVGKVIGTNPDAF
jgi:hypothetical protein